ncbi:MAG TPA: response regulator [Phycisphaerae bacterium]|nr:response regulator [Phycisphaerae bacterium]
MSTRQRKVLVVGDDESALTFVRSVLEPCCYEVSFASDGSAGAVRARRERPDLIILDVYTSRHPGLYTLRDLKIDPITKDIPVIMLTGVGKRLGVCCSTQDLYKHMGTSPDVLLEKPVDPDQLRRISEELIGGGRTEAGPGPQ